jgi:hypothetical protein
MKNILFAILMLTFITVAFAQDGEFHLDKEYKINKKGVLDLVSSDAKVFITGSSRSTAHVKIDRKVIAKGWNSGDDSFNIEVNEQDGNLKIREKQKSVNVSFGYYREEYKIEIELPETVGLIVRGDDGDYYVKNINGAISLSLDDADAELSDCKGEEFKFSFDDGDLRMNTGKGVLELRADDADVEIYNSKFTSINADVDDGDLIIETSLSDKGSYILDSQDGLISMTITEGGGQFDIRHDDGSVRTQGDFQTLFESENNTKLTLKNGNARINISADDASIKLATK